MKKVVAKKHLGQNFLKDESVIDEIFFVAEVTPTDWVFEIGPGTGALTMKLASRVKRLLAIEIDQDLAARLQSQFVDSKRVTILAGDILRINIEEILESSGFVVQPYKIIANIPYYITAPIIRTLLSLRTQPHSLTLMVQDEVAERYRGLISVRTLANWRSMRIGPRFTKIGKTVLYEEGELDAWDERNTVKCATALRE